MLGDGDNIFACIIYYVRTYLAMHISDMMSPPPSSSQRVVVSCIVCAVLFGDRYYVRVLYYDRSNDTVRVLDTKCS